LPKVLKEMAIKNFFNFYQLPKPLAVKFALNSFLRDREYISASQFENIVQNLHSLSNQIGGFCKYLRQAELKGSKFNK